MVFFAWFGQTAENLETQWCQEIRHGAKLASSSPHFGSRRFDFKGLRQDVSKSIFYRKVIEDFDTLR